MGLFNYKFNLLIDSNLKNYKQLITRSDVIEQLTRRARLSFGANEMTSYTTAIQ